MTEYLDKLRPDRDMQCYFERPSAIAALSETSGGGFTVSGCWRQQFDWAVVEWTRDNIFEHPAFRYLPDGDLSALVLTYEESRHNCVALDSTWYPTVDWPYLRIWAERNGTEALYKVALKDHATPVEGDFQAASATFELQGPVTAGDYVELAWVGEHFTYQMYGGDTPENAVLALANAINAAGREMRANAEGNRITLSWSTDAGANGNRIGVYGNVAGAKTESWQPGWQNLGGGTSPTKWRIELGFASLRDQNGTAVPTDAVRKMRWTWAAELQDGSFAGTEFDVVVSNWTVTGNGRRYRVAGPGSRRIEDDSPRMAYTGEWGEARGNYSGGSIRHTARTGAAVTCTYEAGQNHRLYVGTRKAPACGAVSVQVDNYPAVAVNLRLDEDVLVRVPVGEFAGGMPHTVTVTHTGNEGRSFYFDYLEVAVPQEELPVFQLDERCTLATDWDTDHSIALAPERTAWMIRSLGFTGRANHYVGAMWWYGLYQPGQSYASATVTFSGAPEFSRNTELWLGSTATTHLNLVGDTAESIAKAFELEINAGSTALWARAEGAVLTLSARAMGAAGNGLAVAVVTNSSQFTAEVSGPLSGGVDGACRAELEELPNAAWCTDVEARPVINRAARDWQRSLFAALAGYGIPVAAALSMELRHGDPTTTAGLAQRYPGGLPVWLNTPAIQTNFSPASTAFWKQAYAELAGLLVEGGQQPFLQFGEVQWWYFPGASGMPFYDEYTTATFREAHGREMHVFASSLEDPATYPAECSMLAELIGTFTNTVIDFVRASYPEAQFEVLYAPDVNEPALNRAVNLPAAWSPASLHCFKSENFTYTGSRDLDKAHASIRLPLELGFPRSRSSHLIGVGEYTTPWEKESELARGEGLESVVLFALDQFCFIGYGVPLKRAGARSIYMG
ncbi:MAG TPA: hypothetical protein VN442_14295 [Bryobacteraceae bacterium]|nr:hypothetical protein [Bryobacteraceae bacterium]